MTNHTKEPRGTITATEQRPPLRSSLYRNTSQPAASPALQIPNLQLSVTRVPHPPKHALSSKPQPIPVSTPFPTSGLPTSHSKHPQQHQYFLQPLPWPGFISSPLPDQAAPNPTGQPSLYTNRARHSQPCPHANPRKTATSWTPFLSSSLGPPPLQPEKDHPPNIAPSLPPPFSSPDPRKKALSVTDHLQAPFPQNNPSFLPSSNSSPIRTYTQEKVTPPPLE